MTPEIMSDLMALAQKLDDGCVVGPYFVYQVENRYLMTPQRIAGEMPVAIVHEEP